MYQVQKRKRRGYYNQPKARVDYSAALTERSRRARAGWMQVAIQRAALGELKMIDTDLTNAGVSTTATITCLNACQVGTDITNRIGREILMTSVQLRGFFNPSGANTGDIVFWAIVYDRQSNAAAPVWTDVYMTDSIFPETRNLNNRKRFKVLGSGYITVPSATSIDAKYIPFEFYRKLKHPVEYNATNGGTVADIVTGGLFWMVRGITVLGANDVNCSIGGRVRFSDK